MLQWIQILSVPTAVILTLWGIRQTRRMKDWGEFRFFLVCAGTLLLIAFAILPYIFPKT